MNKGIIDSGMVCVLVHVRERACACLTSHENYEGHRHVQRTMLKL
jgi:hypothetical protein